MIKQKHSANKNFLQQTVVCVISNRLKNNEKKHYFQYKKS